jgi:acid phosphatase
VLVLRAGQTLRRFGSFTDTGLDSWSATVDYGDESGLQSLPLRPDNHFLLEHQYQQPGVHLVRVSVFDDDGGVGTAVLAVKVLPGPRPPAPPRPDHLIVVIEENHDFSQVIGSADAPYLNSLIPQGALLTASFGIDRPSQPNYLDLFSGSEQGVISNARPAALPFTTANLGAQLRAAGLSFVGFSESLPSVGFDGDSFTGASGQNQYERKHNPWTNWVNDPVGANQLPASVNQPFTSFPTDFSKLPTIAFVVPNEQNDMHDGTIRQGDDFLKNNLDAYVQFARTHNSMLIVTFDEDGSSPGNSQRIPTIFVGPMVKPGATLDRNVTHFDVLRTLEDMYGLPAAGAAASATAIMSIWTPPHPDPNAASVTALYRR